MPWHRNEVACSRSCQGSVWTQAVNTSPLIHLWSCILSATTPLGAFQANLSSLLFSMPV